MSDNSDHDNSKLSQDSPPTSPSPLSSPAQPDVSSDNSSHAQSNATNSSSEEIDTQSDNSNLSCTSNVSPPSPPVRPGKKRPAYGGYRENPLIPVSKSN